MLFAVMALSSCATLLSKKQTVTVTSDVDGAQVYKGKKFVGVTPLTFQTKSAKSTFTVTKEGYEPQTINTSVAIRWNTLWNWLNGFYPGWLIDLAAGSTQKYTKTDYFVSLKDASINDEYNKENQHQYNTIAFEQVAGIMIDAAAAGIAEGQQRQAEINQQKAEKEAQLRAERQARIAQNNQQLAELKATSTRKVDNSISTRSNTISQSSYSDLLTSDATWNTQVQLMVQQYGIEKTREMVKQMRESDYQQSVQIGKNTPAFVSSNDRVISAVNSNRVQVKIKVRGDVIVAYSTGLDPMTQQQQWTPSIPHANIHKTGAGTHYTGDLAREFSYTASVGNMQIYFDL